MTGFLHEGAAAPLLAGLAFLAALVLAAARRAGRRRELLLGSGRRLPGFARDAALLSALALAVLALLGPRLGTREERVTASGVDLVVLLDVSSSMEARDVPPSRLDRARRNAERVLAGLEPQDRAALAAFAGHGVLLTPLTSDADALLDVLPSLDATLLRARGSNLGDGLRAALSAFDAASARPRVLLVLSDGEDPTRAPLDAGAAVAAGARILGVAIGTAEGTTIPDGDLPLRDAAGEIVRSRADAGRLAALAEATGGAALATDAFGALDPAKAIAEIRRDAATAAGEPTLRLVPAVRVAPLAAAAFGILALEAGLLAGLRRALPLRWRAGRMLTTLLGVGWLFSIQAGAESPAHRDAAGTLRAEAVAGLEAEALARPGDAALWVRLGVARAEAGDAAGARRTLLAAALSATPPQLAALAFYDLGVAALSAGELEAARDAFFDALALDPSDEEARFNLEWTLRALREFVPPPPPDGDASQRRSEGSGATASGAGAGVGETGRSGTTAGAGEAGPGAGAEASGRGASAADEGAGGSAASGAPAAPLLGEEDAARWLDAVSDDPGRALRDAARREAASLPPVRGPGW